MFTDKWLILINWVQTIVIYVCKLISSDTFKNKLTQKLLTSKLYVKLFIYMQTNEFRVSNLCVYISYVLKGNDIK